MTTTDAKFAKLFDEFRRCPTAWVYHQRAAPWGVCESFSLHRGDVFIRYIGRDEFIALRDAGFIDYDGKRTTNKEIASEQA